MHARLPPAAAALVLAGAGAAAADYALTILHTNDFHARYEPVTGFDSTCGPEDNAKGECFGGWARLVTAEAAARAANANDFGPGLEGVVADYLAADPGYRAYRDGRIAER
jgi:5'-nucleotidase